MPNQIQGSAALWVALFLTAAWILISYNGGIGDGNGSDLNRDLPQPAFIRGGFDGELFGFGVSLDFDTTPFVLS